MAQVFQVEALSTVDHLDVSKMSKEIAVAINEFPITPPVTPPETPKEETVEVSYPDIASTLLESCTPISPDTQPLVAVIGVGYVGTHLVSNFSGHWDVLGFDLSENRIQALSCDPAFSQNPRVDFTTSKADLANATHYLISVPTLLLPDKTVDVSYLKSALETTFQYARPGATIVIESSVAVGMTRELLGPHAKARRCFAGMSPEVSVTRFIPDTPKFSLPEF